MIKKFFVYIYANIDLWLAINKAEKAHRGEYVVGNNRDGSPRYSVKGVRYYVMPDDKNRLIIMTRSQMHRFRTSKRMSNEVKVKHLLSESFYFTADKSGEVIDKSLKDYKRKKYIEYCLHYKGR
jgi:hypothetical protein